MISERDKRAYDDICEDLVDEPVFGLVISKLGYIARAQADGQLELLLRSYINQEGDGAISACEALANYTDGMMRRIKETIPDFDTDDMQVVVSGIRSRIEGVIYE